jgi:hypothetical protein
MLFTIAGWFLGWALMDFSGALPGYGAQSVDIVWPAWVAPPVLLAASITVYWRYRTLWLVWVGISLVGVMAGAIFLYQPAWSPSDFVRDVGLAMAHRNAAILPGIDRVGILLFMFMGMFFGAWRYRRFNWAIPGLRPISKHLAGGVLMGLGSSLALGGNDFQLLLALPAVSPAGFSATIGMLVGIRMGLSLTRNRLLKRTFS